MIGKIMDNDIWFILNCGRYVTENGIPHIEPFTIHQGLSYIMQQWMSAVIFWKIYSFSGEAGLIFLVFVFYVLFVYMTFKVCMLLSENNFPVSFIISIVVSSLMLPFMVERPHIFLFPIMLSEIYLLEKFIHYKNIKYLVSLPILSLLLINLEAAIWPILFVIFLPYMIDSFKFKYKFIEGQGYDKKPLIFAALGMLISGFFNPYGIKAMTYLYTSYGYDEMTYLISELMPADINTLMGKVIIGTIFLVAFSMIIYKNGQYRLRYHLLTLGTAYLSLSSIRSFSFFIICGIIPLAYYFKNYSIPIKLIKNDKKTLRIRKILLMLLVITAIAGIVYQNKMTSDDRQKDLGKAVDYLEQLNKQEMVLYSGFNDGGYIEFRGLKTYIDPRAEVFLKSNNGKDDIMKEYEQMHRGKIYYKDVLKKYKFTHLVLSDNDMLYGYLDYDNEYELIYSSAHYKIYEKVKF